MTVNYDHLSFSFCVRNSRLPKQRWRLEVGLAGRRPDARDLSAHGVG